MAKSICYFYFPVKKKLKCLYFPLGYFFHVMFDPLLCQLQLKNNRTGINQPILW